MANARERFLEAREKAKRGLPKKISYEDMKLHKFARHIESCVIKMKKNLLSKSFDLNCFNKDGSYNYRIHMDYFICYTFGIKQMRNYLSEYLVKHFKFSGDFDIPLIGKIELINNETQFNDGMDESNEATADVLIKIKW